MKNLKNQGDIWDHYVKNVFPNKKSNSDRELNYPGDEWAKLEFWDQIYSDIFVPLVKSESKYFIEIGSGSGKQTIRTINNFDVRELHSFDISSEFIKVFNERFSDSLGKTVFSHKLNDDYSHIYQISKRRKLVNKIDCVYSFDAMVHVDLQHLLSYFVTAAQVLKLDGHLIMDVANAMSQKGIDKLFRDIKSYYKFFGAACTKFQFMSKEIIESFLTMLGFEVNFYDDPRGHCLFSAQLKSKINVADISIKYDLFNIK